MYLFRRRPFIPPDIPWVDGTNCPPGTGWPVDRASSCGDCLARDEHPSSAVMTPACQNRRWSSRELALAAHVANFNGLPDSVTASPRRRLKTEWVVRTQPDSLASRLTEFSTEKHRCDVHA
jgi:hypothetical protein